MLKIVFGLVREVIAKVSGKVKVELKSFKFCGRAKKMPSDRSKVEIYYFMSSVTAQNKFLVGTFFCPAIIKYHIPI